ncbi:hypothetical protein [Phormidium pseudopriestleyi]|uniref:hypothetical protein n=1 Tax=Phormidium pseudopriestleyi TaxID=1759527 RepID=UPI001A8F8C82|nr:hypothetical protein [Phormidium pseudopriestleyi]
MAIQLGEAVDPLYPSQVIFKLLPVRSAKLSPYPLQNPREIHINYTPIQLSNQELA